MLFENKYKLRVLLFLMLIKLPTLHAQNIDLLLTGIRSTVGQIIVKIYMDEAGFDDDKPIKTLKFKKTDLIKGEIASKLNLEPGTYGFALLDDENNNNLMNYNFFGMPEEGFGFSNFYLTGFKKPKFEQFKFTLRKDQKLKVSMKIRYL